MIRALLESVWLFYLVGAMLWGYLGLLAASSQRLPLIVGVLAGAFFWFFGVLVVYVVGFIRSRAARLPRHPVGGRSTPAQVTGLFAATAMLVSILLPWGSGRVAWSREQQHVGGNLQPLHFAPVAVVIVVSAAALAAVVLLDANLRRGIWLGVGAVVVSFWFALLIEWMTLDTGLNDASDTVSSATGRVTNVSFNAAAGAWLMLAASVGVYAWLAWRTVALLIERRTAPAVPTTGWSLPHEDAPSAGWGASGPAQGWGLPTPNPATSNESAGWGTSNFGDGWAGNPSGMPESRSPW